MILSYDEWSFETSYHQECVCTKKTHEVCVCPEKPLYDETQDILFNISEIIDGYQNDAKKGYRLYARLERIERLLLSRKESSNE